MHEKSKNGLENPKIGPRHIVLKQKMQTGNRYIRQLKRRQISSYFYGDGLKHNETSEIHDVSQERSE